ncbi:putative O-glycosylation ligase, exosortase A system-associated [Rhodocista pekingensis]|uniref:O-glycosylation ligase, exosortase A system-associated n=1 Tax=Rhodocista pekingensis TaxID=201185 RepID=A0ABW2L126_9PROT
MRDLFLVGCVGLSLPFIIWRPSIGVLLWCWLAYMNPHRLAYGFAYSLPLAMLVGTATILGFLLSREARRVPVDGITVTIGLIMAWITVTTAFALFPDDAVVKWDQSMKMLVFTVLMIAVMHTRERLQAMVWMVVLSLWFYGIKGGLFTLLTGGADRVWGPPGSFIADNNALGLALLMTLPLARYLQLSSASKAVRRALGVGIVLIGLAVIGTQSRGAFVGGVAMAVFYVLLTRHKVRGLLTMAALGLCALAFVPQSWMDRMNTIRTYEQDMSAQERLWAWEYGYRLALERPVLGGGFHSYLDEERLRAYVPDAMRVRAYHSVYFEVLGDHGFVGLGLFAAFGLACWLKAEQIVRRARGDPEQVWLRDLARMAQVSLVAYAVSGAFQNLAFFDLVYNVAAILVIAGAIQADAGRSAAASPASPLLRAAA